MRPVKQISYNRSTRSSAAKIQYIVIHDTGNKGKGANAQAHYNYFNGGNRNASADFFVDDKEILCINDYTKYYSWHCGDGKGKYGITNTNSVGIELCINSDSNREKAVANLVTITKELMKELNIPIDRVVRHYDASRKNCPQTMAANNWAEWIAFKNSLIETPIPKAEPQVTSTPVFNTVEEIPGWGKSTIDKLVKAGFVQGSSGGLNLSMDMLRVLVIIDRAGLFK